MIKANQGSRFVILLAGLCIAAAPFAQSVAAPGNSHANANSNSHGPGNSNANANSSSHGLGNSNGPGNSQGAMASKLGALNAAHASPNAFANASPNSRVGKIAAYQAANAAFTKALSSACQSSSACGSALTAFDTAKANYAANPTAANLAALNQARTALAAAQKAVVQASTTLQALQKAALAALNAAANKHPVTASVRAALNALLAKK